MYLVEQHIITVNDKRYKDLDRICFLSKNLYNVALYTIKQEFLNTGKWIRAVDLNKKMVAENNIDYRAMSGSSSQQIHVIMWKILFMDASISLKAFMYSNLNFIALLPVNPMTSIVNPSLFIISFGFSKSTIRLRYVIIA